MLLLSPNRNASRNTPVALSKSMKFQTQNRPTGYISKLFTMGVIEENVIPGNHGKVFKVDIEDEFEFSDVQETIMQLDGVKDVLFDDGVYPHEIIVHTEELVKIADVQTAIKKHGYHAIPEGLFPLY